MSRKVSVDSVGDQSTDDLLRFLYDLTFRQPTSWGWAVAAGFAALPTWLAIVCITEGNAVGGTAFIAMAATVPGLRYYLLRKKGFSAVGKVALPANDG